MKRKSYYTKIFVLLISMVFFWGKESKADREAFLRALAERDTISEPVDKSNVNRPSIVVIQAVDKDKAVVRWLESRGAVGYKVYMAVDGEDLVEVADVTEFPWTTVHGLEPGTTYQVGVSAYNEEMESTLRTTRLTTIEPALRIHFPLDELKGENQDQVYDVISGDLTPAVGQHVVMDEASSGLGMPATRFVQDELEGIQSYAMISKYIVNSDINDDLISRTISLWVKNEMPSLWSVPISIEKRTGMTLVFKNDSVYAITKDRLDAYFDQTEVSSIVGVPYTSRNWNFITMVNEHPYTHLYINGELAASVEADWPFPAPWEVETTGDKSAEIGCLYDACAGMVQFLNGRWSEGPRHFFYGSMADIKIYNHALTPEEVMEKFTSVFSVAAPEMVVNQARDADRAIISWTQSQGATAYKVYLSTDGENYTEAAVITDALWFELEGLSEGTTYFVRITALQGELETSPAETSFTTSEPSMNIHFPLDQLVDDNHVQEAVTGAAVPVNGQIQIIDAEESGIGIAAARFVQDESGANPSYIDISETIANADINSNLMSRSLSLWVKNDDPSGFSVPVSIEKQSGVTIAFKQDSIYVMTKQALDDPLVKAETTNIISAPYTTTAWSMLTWVYDHPSIRFYINGRIVDTGLANWDFPGEWQVEADGEISAEIGALLNPCVGVTELLGGVWEFGPQYLFSGSIADIKLYNYPLREEDILQEFEDMETSVKILPDKLVSLFPNPASNVLYVDAALHAEVDVTIFNVIGKSVLSQKIHGKQGIDISHLDTGIYIVRINNNVAFESHRIMIAR